MAFGRLVCALAESKLIGPASGRSQVTGTMVVTTRGDRHRLSAAPSRNGGVMSLSGGAEGCSKRGGSALEGMEPPSAQRVALLCADVYGDAA